MLGRRTRDAEAYEVDTPQAARGRERRRSGFRRGRVRERRFFYLSYTLQLGALLALLVPFLRRNNLLEWDFPGHYAAIWHLSNVLFPWPTGWNPSFYCGYPQGLFYPPLAHYATALIGFAIGIAPAMKLLVALSILALPAVFYAFARRYELDDLQSAVAATWMTALLFVTGDLLGTWNLGSDLKSMLNVGLFANTLSLPVLFAFLALCGRDASWRRQGAVLGILLLLHPLSAMIALLFALSHGAAEWTVPAAERRSQVPLARTVAVGILVAAVWLLPFAAYRRFMNAEFTPALWSTAVQLVVCNGLVVALLSVRRPVLRSLIFCYVLLANFILVGTLWKLDVQFTRLTIYLLLFVPVLVVHWVRSRAVLAVLAVVAVGVGAAGYRKGGLNPAGVPDFAIPNFGPVPGRILSVAPPQHLASFHVNHELIPLRTGNPTLMGLFVESSLNGRYVGDLMHTLEPDSYVWGTPTEALTRQALGTEYAAYVRDRLRLFDVRHIYTDLKLESLLDPELERSKTYVNSYPAPSAATAADRDALARRYNVRDGKLDFYLYTVGGSTLAEPLSYIPVSPGSDWKITATKWFIEMRGIPVFTDRPAPAGVRPARAGDSVRIEENRGDRLRLRIDADADIPVLVKVGYFPSWRLTVDGRTAPIYRASPNLMLVFAHGDAVLEYRRPWQEYAGLLLSLVGLLLVTPWRRRPAAAR